jgi:hypothetical protein
MHRRIYRHIQTVQLNLHTACMTVIKLVIAIIYFKYIAISCIENFLVFGGFGGLVKITSTILNIRS